MKSVILQPGSGSRDRALGASETLPIRNRVREDGLSVNAESPERDGLIRRRTLGEQKFGDSDFKLTHYGTLCPNARAVLVWRADQPTHDGSAPATCINA